MKSISFISSYFFFFFFFFIQLRDANKQEFIERVAKFAASKPAGRWLKGGHWNHENWGAELPHHDWIDDVTKNNPAYLWRLDGHMGRRERERGETGGEGRERE